MTALEAVMSVDEMKARLEHEAEALSLATDDESQALLSDIYERLDALDSDQTEARAGQILHGLGFTKTMQNKKTRDFSGGWRMRIALARALFVDPALLILDEPTNHLDLEACVWLEETLKNFSRILLVISHSQDFMNGVCTNIIHMHQKQLKNYGEWKRERERESFSLFFSFCFSFCEEKEEVKKKKLTLFVLFLFRSNHLSLPFFNQNPTRRKLRHLRAHQGRAGGGADEEVQVREIVFFKLLFSLRNDERLRKRRRRKKKKDSLSLFHKKLYKQNRWEQEQIADMKEYIARFGHGSAKLARQAQSKEKTLEKMVRSGLTEKVERDATVKLAFTNVGKLPPPVLQFADVTFGYSKDAVLYRHVDLGIDLDSRIALVGPNGAGKSTLLKLMTGELEPLDGMVKRHNHLKMGVYHQHLAEALDGELSPLEYMMQEFPGNTIETMRGAVGRFGITGKAQTLKMSQLSDGLKSRVVFAWLARKTPHMLLLDEPTNHLDIETIDSLAAGINDWDGGLVLVSHDFRLISQVANEILVVADGTVKKWPGGILDYKKHLKKSHEALSGTKQKMVER